MDIRFIKLITGEDVVTAVSEETDDTLTLKNPTKIIATPEGVGMGPIHPFLKTKEVKIRKDHVVYMGETEREVQNAYNSQFGSGIVTAPANALNLVGIDD